MPKEPTFISRTALIAALETMRDVMKKEVEKYPELAYEVAEGGLTAPSLAVVFTFDRKTLRHKSTTVCSEKRAAKEWNKANVVRN